MLRLLDRLRHRYQTYMHRRRMDRIEWKIQEIKSWDVSPEFKRSQLSAALQDKESVAGEYRKL
jgi:hypothetical protein